MQILVTGASGFIGLALVRRLLARGDRVRAFVRSTSPIAALRRAGAELAPGELESGASLAAALEGCEAVVHLAGAIKVRRQRDYLRVNGEGTARLAAACTAAGRPPVLVHVSSLAAAGPAISGRPRTEEDLPAPVSRYGESKLAGERAVRAVAGRVPVSIVRPPIVYGPGDRELVPALHAMARLGLAPRFARASRSLSLVEVDDLCRGIAAVLDRGARLGPSGGQGIYFLDDGGPHTWEEIALAAAAPLGARLRFVTLPLAAARPLALAASALSRLAAQPALLSLDKLREIRQPAWTCDGQKARRELGFAPALPLAAGMRRAIEARLARRAGLAPAIEPGVAAPEEQGRGADG